jgi:ABC-type taurine transport system substrate-binding protein
MPAGSLQQPALLAPQSVDLFGKNSAYPVVSTDHFSFEESVKP